MKTALVIAALALAATAQAAQAQDVAAGEQSFKKCIPCHSIGEGAKNKVGPELNGLDGRKSGTAPDYSYTDANKKSGITWSEATFKEYIRIRGQDSRHQDGLRRHQEREGDRRPVGLSQAVRPDGKKK